MAQEWDLRDLELEDAREEVLEPVDGEPVLPVETVEEHVSRHGGDYEYVLNSQDRDVLKADLGERKLEVENLSDGRTRIKYLTEHPATESIYEREIGKLVEREKGVIESVDMLERTLEEREKPPEFFSDEIERLGGSHLEIAERYYSSEIELSEILVPYAFHFELKPWQAADDNYHESLEREIPLGENDEKGVYWLRKYLDTATERIAGEYGELQEHWIENTTVPAD